MFESLTTFSLLLALIFVVVFSILVTLLAILIYSGIFHGIEEVGTGKPPVVKVIIAYKFQKGPYHEAGQIFTEAAIVAPKNKALGIYYDDPKKVHSLHLRYVVGSIISEGETPIDENMVRQFMDRGFKMLHLPEVTFAVRTKFPHITTLSILIGIHKAYPRLEAYIEEHKLCAHPCMEYYDGKNIHFFAPLSKQDEFYVPECTNEAAGAGDVDQTQSEADSASELNESGTSFNITQTSTSVDSTLDQNESVVEEDKEDLDEKGDEEMKTEKQPESDAKPSQDGSNDDDVSDDSASSFEVLKKEV